MTLVFNSMGSMIYHRLPEGFQQTTLYGPHNSEDEIRRIMSEANGDGILVLEGGADISPALYHEEVTYTHWVSEHRDEHEVRCFNVARELGLPILGHCRGHQLMAALSGGSLYQDIAKELGRPHGGGHHIVFTEEAERAGFIKLMESNPLGSPDVVNSLHHQALRQIPDDAVVLARHPRDKTPEALLYPWGLSVQWHPELMHPCHSQFLVYVRDRFIRKSHDNAKHNNGAGDRVTISQ